MANMTRDVMIQILKRYPTPPSVLVESGTWHGNTTRLAAQFFGMVHTIEINPELYMEATRLLPGNVHCHLGNSADVVPGLAVSIQEPICWYLDAHWFTDPKEIIAGKDVPLPLWAELYAIAQRVYEDIIIVDDVHAFNGKGPTDEWKDVTFANITTRIPSFKKAEILNDQAVIWK
jgi:hypothetical protein